jgi:hypothetical protein
MKEALNVGINEIASFKRPKASKLNRFLRRRQSRYASTEKVDNLF